MTDNKLRHAFDTPLSSGLRFLSELIAWVAGPWAIAAIFSGWLAIPALVLLVGLPGVFSTPGDKRQIIVATPGPLRVLIELLQYSVAVIAPWIIWPGWAAVLCVFCVIASIVVGLPRLRWLMAGAPDKPAT
ncbi:MAG: hypothetical protein O7I42_21590 [Alphaproteobacteria bacterium]|nr:hypothetical protein [Alphaproteobacteria bacterium]